MDARRPSINWKQIAAGLVVSCMALLPAQAQSVVGGSSACGAKLVVTGTYCLDSDLTIGSVHIKREGVLCTNEFTLTISCPGGLTVNGPNALELGGELRISTGGSVILEGGGTSTIDGLVKIQSATSVLSITDKDHTLAGDGAIILQNDSARIDIALSKTLTLDTDCTIMGQGQIKGLSSGGNRGAFVNNGTVEANVNNGVLELMNETGLSGSGAWTVTLCPVGALDDGARLRFSRAATGLTGSFTIDGGVLDIDADVTTNVDIVYHQGKIDVAGSATFTFGDGTGDDSSGDCGTQPESALGSEVFEGCSC